MCIAPRYVVHPDLRFPASDGRLYQQPNTPATAVDLGGIQSASYNVPPKQLLGIVKQVIAAPPLAIPIEQESKGTVLTAFKEGYRGDFHITRYWQERTRYRIMVTPDWDDPAGHSMLQVSDETQVRSNDRGTWQADPRIQRPERREELVRLIRQQIPETVGR